MVTTAYKTRFNKNYFELNAWKENKVVCGIDEVGRGCLAGPVVVAALVLFPNKINRQLRDSKIMTAEEREKAFMWIKKNSWSSIGLVHNRAIDQHNIYQSTLIAMKRAYLQLVPLLTQKPTAIIIDAMPLKLTNTAHEETEIFYFPFGESKSSSIAAASIIAKVTRDRLMTNHFATIFPGYEFASNKGYGTPPHKRSLHNLGHSIIHRVNFLPKINDVKNDDQLQQQTFLNLSSIPEEHANVRESLQSSYDESNP